MDVEGYNANPVWLRVGRSSPYHRGMTRYINKKCAENLGKIGYEFEHTKHDHPSFKVHGQRGRILTQRSLREHLLQKKRIAIYVHYNSRNYYIPWEFNGNFKVGKFAKYLLRIPESLKMAHFI